MADRRLQETRAAYESQDPINRLAKIYLTYASGLIRDGRSEQAIKAIDEAVRILGIEHQQPSALDNGYFAPRIWEP